MRTSGRPFSSTEASAIAVGSLGSVSSASFSHSAKSAKGSSREREVCAGHLDLSKGVIVAVRPGIIHSNRAGEAVDPRASLTSLTRATPPRPRPRSRTACDPRRCDRRAAGRRQSAGRHRQRNGAHVEEVHESRVAQAARVVPEEGLVIGIRLGDRRRDIGRGRQDQGIDFGHLGVERGDEAQAALSRDGRIPWPTWRGPQRCVATRAGRNRSCACRNRPPWMDKASAGEKPPLAFAACISDQSRSCEIRQAARRASARRFRAASKDLPTVASRSSSKRAGENAEPQPGRPRAAPAPRARARPCTSWVRAQSATDVAEGPMESSV